ncbi:MAG: tRNA pseudouridine(55) synthase TruB [Endomicrobiia bacterium]
MINFKEGIYNIYKPKGITTYKIIETIKKFLPKKTKVGHGGTLDPLAEGVVVVAIGRNYTKQLHNILKNSKKEYIAEIFLDKISDTYDLSGKVEEITPKEIPTLEKIKEVLKIFIGEIEQIPPIYSAIKIKGKRLCDIVRKGKISYEEAKKFLKPKKVVIYNIKLLEYNYPKLVIEVVCSSGTYIRSLAKDIGEKLGCGGVVGNLIRTKVDKFSIENAIKI